MFYWYFSAKTQVLTLILFSLPKNSNPNFEESYYLASLIWKSMTWLKGWHFFKRKLPSLSLETTLHKKLDFFFRVHEQRYYHQRSLGRITLSDCVPLDLSNIFLYNPLVSHQNNYKVFTNKLHYLPMSIGSIETMWTPFGSLESGLK